MISTLQYQINFWMASHNYTVNQKTDQNVFWYTVYKTRPIVIKYGTYCPSKLQKRKHFPPHLNSVSTLACETWHSRFAREQQWNEKHTKMFLSYLLQNEADSDKVC